MPENISVAVATYNGEAYVARQIDSILSQNYPINEIIIIDDFSTDGTVRILQRYQKNIPKIKLFINDRNLGPIATFSKAVSKCEGDYVALCDQDDIWEMDKIGTEIRELKKIESRDVPSMVFTDLKIINSDGDIVHPSFWTLQGYKIKKLTFQKLLFGNVVTGCTILMNKRMALELHYVPRGVLMHDHWLALIGYGFGKVSPVYKTTIKYRAHNNTVTSKEPISFFLRLKLFIYVVFGNKEQLIKNLIQAEQFYYMYNNELSKEQIKRIQSYLELKKYPGVIYKLCSFYIKWFK